MGNNEDPTAKMGGSDVGGRKREGGGVVSEHVQLTPHRGQPTTCTRRDVLDDDEARADLIDDAREMPPEAGAGAADASPFSGAGDVLTGESSANNVNVRIPARLGDIAESLHVGPVFREHGAAKGIVLDLPGDGAEPGPLEAKLQAADPAEERAEGERHAAPPIASSCAPASVARQRRPSCRGGRCSIVVVASI